MTSTGPPGYAVHEHFSSTRCHPYWWSSASWSPRSTHPWWSSFIEEGHLGLSPGNGNLSLLTCEVFGENFFYRIHVAWAIEGTVLCAVCKYCCTKPKKSVSKIAYLLGGAQGYHFHQPVSRLPAVFMKYIDVYANIVKTFCCLSDTVQWPIKLFV